jgi:hypothetical protein
VAAWNKLVDAQESLVDVKTYVEAKDWAGLLELLGQDEFANMEENLLKLINGPVLNTDDKKTIGTRKRYGIAADVIYGIGGVKGAIENIDNPQVMKTLVEVKERRIPLLPTRSLTLARSLSLVRVCPFLKPQNGSGAVHHLGSRVSWHAIVTTQH